MTQIDDREKLTVITVRMTTAQKRKLMLLAAKAGLSISSLIRSALEEGLFEQVKKRPEEV